MALYPCPVCRQECQNGTIYCSACANWVHATCTNLTDLDLREWSKKCLEFVCVKCAILPNEDYNAEAALNRLKKNLRNEKVLLNIANSEEKLLKLYQVTIPKREITNIVRDSTSARILNVFHPPMLKIYQPHETFGDGNCLFRAVSLAVSATQDNHVLLRLYTALELIQNKVTYDTRQKHNDFIRDIRIVTSDYDKLLHDTLTLGNYCEMAHIYALSAALNSPISSYYPPQVESEFTSEAFTRKVLGRNVRENAMHMPIKIMWSSTSCPTNELKFEPNHFVPLIKNNISNETIIEIENEQSFHDDFNNDDRNNGTQNDPQEVNNAPQCDEEEESSIPESSSKTDESRFDEDSGMKESDHCSGNLTTSFLSSTETITLLLNTKEGLKRIPNGKKENVYFVLDNSGNIENKKKNKKSSFSDDCGVWDASKGTSPKFYFLVRGDGDYLNIFNRKGVYCVVKTISKKREYVPLDPQPSTDKVVVVQKYYTILKADPNYKRRVSWLGDGGLKSSFALVEYVGTFPGLSSHANSNKSSEYIRTPDYVLDEARQLCKEMKPHQVYQNLQSKYDEVTRPTSISQIRDLQKYAEKTKKTDNHMPRKNVADNFNILENMVSDNDDFVRSVIRTSGKTPTVVLYTDEQLSDMKNLCCSGKSVLGVDKTFNLCDMHVTVTCYKQHSVVRPQTGKCPIFIGPLFIHDNSDFETYSTFFHHIKMKMVSKNVPTDRLVIGSDDEKSLVKAAQSVFHESSHVLCTRHLRQNAKQKLVDDAVSLHARNEILQTIFGDDGILDSHDDLCFDHKCDLLETRLTGLSVKFLNYFQTRLKPLLKDMVHRPTQMDIVEDMWTNNNCESINHVLKQTTDWKTKSIVDLVAAIRSIVLRQFSDLRSALIGTGEYRLADSHEGFKLSKTDWISMTDDRRNRHYQKFRSHVPEKDGQMTSTDGRTTIVAPKTHGKKPGQNKRKVNARTTTTTSKKQKTM